MIHVVDCPYCRLENPNPHSTSFISFDDKQIHKVQCANGHQYIYMIQNQKFELLFELALYAHSDGYFREAVTSSAAALERFMEFYVNIILFHVDIEKENIDRFWRPMKTSSERQYGAFSAIYLLHNRREAPTLSQKVSGLRKNAVEFRNSVVHQGTIPSADEAQAYCGFVFDFVAEICRTLPWSYSAAILTAIGNNVVNSSEYNIIEENRAGPKVHVVTGISRTALEFYQNGTGPLQQDFAEAVKASKENRRNLERMRRKLSQTSEVDDDEG